ncbi:MAG: hypothetical protein KGI58_03155 [Patescibacteria group bacterium]|nr:hypothetical protein [Patescibacteria group bacterium]
MEKYINGLANLLNYKDDAPWLIFVVCALILFCWVVNGIIKKSRYITIECSIETKNLVEKIHNDVTPHEDFSTTTNYAELCFDRENLNNAKIYKNGKWKLIAVDPEETKKVIYQYEVKKNDHPVIRLNAE